jgi:hypothetical protein
MAVRSFSLVILLIHLLCRTSIGEAAVEKIDVINGQLELAGIDEEASLVKGDWRLARTQLDSITAEEFEKLPLANPFRSNIQYLALFQENPEGAYILRIRSSVAQEVEVMFGGLTGKVQILLQQSYGRKILYETADYHQQASPGLNQIPKLLLGLYLEAGDQYLIVNYAQKPVIKSDGVFVNAGLIGPMRLGLKRIIDRHHEFSELFLKIPLGVFACLAAYSLLIYTSRRGEDKESLVLFVLNASVFLKEIFNQGIYTSFLPTSQLLITMSAMGFAFPFLTSAVSIYYLQMKYTSRFLHGLFIFVMTYTALMFLNGALLVNVDFLPNTAFVTTLGTFLNALVFFVIFIPFALYISIRSRDYQVIAFTIGILIMAAGSILDFFNQSSELAWPWLTMPGGIVMSLVLAKNNSLMFAKAYDDSKQLNTKLEVKNKEVESLNALLEMKVEERTAEINALLQHIPQGVLSIGPQGMIEGNFSAQLPDVLGHADIRQKSFKEVFLDLCDMSADQRDQCWQTIQASIQESALNFEINSDKFPQEIWYVYQDKRKLIKLTWNAELDAQETVRGILVTMLDISQEYEARRELEEKNKDLAIIRELIDAGVKKSLQFFSTARQLLQENQLYLTAGDLNIDTVKILFVNMHTVKGAARTLQFKDLSAALHECESPYAAIIKQGASIIPERLQDDLKQLFLVFDRYVHVNCNVLGRSEDYSKIPIDREFLEHHYQLLNTLDQKVALASELKDVIHRNKDELTHMIFMSLSMVMSDIMQQSEKIARDLQKEQPRIVMNIAEILINHRQENTLKNSFIHILRNALDHGIETGAERQAQGKNPHGLIHVDAYEDALCIYIEVWDDGRGLAIGKLREKAEAAGQIKVGASLQEVANTIFIQGMSTAKTLSQVSGRGVGMDAVKRFFEADHGQIVVLPGDPKDAEKQFYNFKFRISLPREDAEVDFDNPARVSMAS